MLPGMYAYAGNGWSGNSRGGQDVECSVIVVSRPIALHWLIDLIDDAGRSITNTCRSGSVNADGPTQALSTMASPLRTCDLDVWRLFGLSLAAYNAMVQIVVAAACLSACAGSQNTVSDPHR